MVSLAAGRSLSVKMITGTIRLRNRSTTPGERDVMSKTAAKKDDLFERVQKAAKRQMTPEERKAQRVSFIISSVGRTDSTTRQEVEGYVNERYGTTHG